MGTFMRSSLSTVCIYANRLITMVIYKLITMWVQHFEWAPLVSIVLLKINDFMTPSFYPSIHPLIHPSCCLSDHCFDKRLTHFYESLSQSILSQTTGEYFMICFAFWLSDLFFKQDSLDHFMSLIPEKTLHQASTPPNKAALFSCRAVLRLNHRLYNK